MMGHCSDPFWGSPLLSDNVWALWIICSTCPSLPSCLEYHWHMSSHVLPTWHMLLILPGKSCILYLPGQLLQEFRIQIRYHLFCQPSLIWAHLSDGIYAQWDHCLLTPLSLTLNCGLTEVRNRAWFTSLPAPGKGLDKRTFKHMLNSFILSFNKCLLSIYLTSSVLGAGDTVEYKIDQTLSVSLHSILLNGRTKVCMNAWMNELMPKGINEWKTFQSDAALSHLIEFHLKFSVNGLLFTGIYL